MNTYRKTMRLRILALILLALFLPGCLGNGAKGTPAQADTATALNQGQPATIEATVTQTLQAREAASSTPMPVEENKSTETPLPTQTEEPPVPTPTGTPEIVPTNTEAPALAADADVYEPIPGCARSRLHWGYTIRISQKIEYVRIRSTPDTHPADNIVRKLYRSELAKITGLPVCNYGWILWPIQTADGTRGWVPESDGIDFWLVNYNSYFFPSATPLPNG